MTRDPAPLGIDGQEGGDGGDMLCPDGTGVGIEIGRGQIDPPERGVCDGLVMCAAPRAERATGPGTPRPCQFFSFSRVTASE